MNKAAYFCLPLAAVSVPASAQVNQSEPYQCDAGSSDGDIIAIGCNIVVTGNLPTSISEISESMQRIQIGAGRVETALAQVPGLQQFRRSDARSANPTSQGVTLRGLGGNASSRAVLILDDVPQSDPFGGWISWPGYDALNLASIRVRKGGGNVRAGSGALAGTIELDSLQNTNLFSGSAAYGSRDSMAVQAALMRKLGDGTLSISGSFARGDGFIPIIASQRGSVDRPAPYEQAGIAVRAVAPLTADIQLQANVRAFRDERDRGFDFSDNQNSGVDASLRLVNRGSGWQWSALGYIQLRDFSNRFGAIAANRNSVNITLDQFSVPSTGVGARFEMRPPLGSNAELKIGGEWRRTTGETKENFFFSGTVPGRYRNAGGRTDTLGAFAEASFEPSAAFTITAGARADHWEIARGFRKEVNIGGSVRSDDTFTDRSGWEGTGRIGAALQANEKIKLRASTYLGWRLPTLNELYRPFRVGADATAANELLAPERLKGAEAGVEFSAANLLLSATAFANRLDNAIANVTLGRGPGVFPGVGFVANGGAYRQRQNLDAINSKGVELDARLSLNAITLRAGYAYVDANVKSRGAAAGLSGLRPAQVPRHFANVGAGYSGRALSIDAGLRYVGRQYEDDANTAQLRDAVTIDAAASYAITNNFRVEFRGENLFDAQVQAAISSAGVVERATPRTVWAGMSFKY
jgi:outer membrane receptor protein involved in Fe transport